MSPARQGLCILALLLCAHASARAEGDDDEIRELRSMSLEELLAQPVTVASLRPWSASESPGIVTVITRAEIVNSGARDLIDVLRLVPGFYFASDVSSAVALGFRGNWAYEGKVLILWDGHEIAERMFLTAGNIANHYPLDQIKRIEIIRGPGSAIYGGFAELAVINIVTRSAGGLSGAHVSSTYGQMADGFGRASLSMAYGQKHGDLEVVAHGHLAWGNRSDRTYSDFYGNSYDMGGQSAVDTRMLGLGLTYRGLEARFLLDHYVTSHRDGYAFIYSELQTVHHPSYHADLRYTWQISDGLRLVPRLQFKRQLPFNTADDIVEDSHYDKTNDHYRADVTGTYDIMPALSLLFGAQLYLDHARLNDRGVNDSKLIGVNQLFAGKEEISYWNWALLSQVQYDHAWANLTLGGRLEWHSSAGYSAVPRFALTKAFRGLHFKLLASQAFKPPGIENINLGQGRIVPESTTVYEMEIGYQLGGNMFAAMNLFDIDIEKAIIYYVDPEDASTGGYRNFGNTGTRGLELDFRLKYPIGYANLNYSFYTAAGKNEVAVYAVPGNERALLAAPRHKLTAGGSIEPLANLHVSPSLAWLVERHGYALDDAGMLAVKRFDDALLVNLALRYTIPSLPGLSVVAAAHDLLGKRFELIQPYDGGHAAMPGPSREIGLTVSYYREM